MPFSVVMPALEMAQETGKLIAWRKREGDPVTKGEPLLEIETDKAVMEIEAPADGILAGISAQTGADIPVGRTIAWIVAPGENPPVTEAISPAAQGKTESQASTASANVSAPSSRTRISPKARRLATELGIEIDTVRGSGPGGEILAADIQAAHVRTTAPKLAVGEAKRSEAESKDGPEVSGRSAAHEPGGGTLYVPSTLARLMAERTAQSWTTVPHFFVMRDADGGALNDYRAKQAAEIERAHNIRITHTDLLIALVARVLLSHPRLNSSWTAQGIRHHDHVSVGVAIAVDDGVVAPVIHNAHRATLPEIGQQRNEIAERARAGKLRPADLADATFTISNLGMYRVDQFTAIITPPQAAILAVGNIIDRVVAVEGKPTVRPMMSLTLSCDHRVVDGARAALFLNDLVQSITCPQDFV
jgi:pyruvate dehydrogenase E2 component (dihydrolipoamide acetyltransferase)